MKALFAAILVALSGCRTAAPAPPTSAIATISAKPRLVAPAPASLNVTLAWNASTDSSVTGYRIYWGGASGTYTNMLDAGLVLTTTVSNLAYGPTYYFAGTAYDAAGLESSFSNEVSYMPPPPPGPPAPTVSLVGLVSANTPLGPWYAIGSIPALVSQTTTQQFFRLQIGK
jgi:hypothetical protein